MSTPEAGLKPPQTSLAPWLASWTAMLLGFVSMTALGSDVLLYRDHTFVFRRRLFAVVHAYSQGRLPVWDPSVGLGEPLLANPNSLAFSPVLALFALPVDFHQAYDLFVVAHLAIGAFGSYVLGRTLGLDREPSLLLAMSYCLSGPYLSANDLLAGFVSMSFGPWAIAATLSAMRAPSPGRLAAMALALALHVMSSDPSFLFCSILVGIVLLLTDSQRPRDKKSLVGAALALFGGALLAATLLAIELLPVFEILRGTKRGEGFDTESRLAFSISPARLLGLFAPGAAGDLASGQILFRDPQLRNDHYLHSLYLGASLAPIWFSAIVVPRARAVLGLCGVLILASTGSVTPFYEILSIMPGLDSSRYPSKLLYGVALSGSVAMALALQSALSSPRKGMDAAAALGGVLVVALSLYLSFGNVDALANEAVASFPVEPLLRGAGAAGLAFGLCGAGLFYAYLRRPSRPILLTLFALGGVDLATAGRSLLVTGPRAALDPPAAAKIVTRDDRAPGVFLYSPLQAPTQSPRADAYAIHAFHRLIPTAGVPLGIRYALDQDQDGLRPGRYVVIGERFAKSSEPERMRLLGRLSMSHLLVEADIDRAPHLERVSTARVPFGEPISVFRVSPHRGPLTFVDQAVVRPDLESAVLTLTSTLPISLVVIERSEFEALEPAVAGALTAMVNHGAPASPSAARTNDSMSGSIGAGTVTATLSTTGPGALLVAQRADPGWRAKVDGAPADLRVAEGALILVPIAAAGPHSVELTYSPRQITTGSILSILALLILGALVVLGLRRS
ncbi:MAG: hypothetical protein HY791_32835 [Deltaproteobacteria bacterium]|nr:hypothetical protein [Deltaproteobacteria bacterium]